MGFFQTLRQALRHIATDTFKGIHDSILAAADTPFDQITGNAFFVLSQGQHTTFNCRLVL